MPGDDTPNSKRPKKSDKAKEKHERNGNFSQKHIRLQEQLQEKRKNQSKPNF